MHVSDRSYVLGSLTLGFLSCFFLIDYESKVLKPTLVVIGLSLLLTSFLIGRIVTNNMYAKLIGNAIHRSYFTYSLIVIALTRISAAYYNIELL